MSKVKNYITTGEAAAIFDVEPDTVLRWIKSGDIPAISTPGGHYRINRNVFLTKMIKDTSPQKENVTQSPLSYCWEYNSQAGKIRDECKDCIVYKSKASKCYELCNLPVSIGHAKLFCSKSCNDCSYFQRILQSAS
jgi:excisionase family DNA binding protein